MRINCNRLCHNVRCFDDKEHMCHDPCCIHANYQKRITALEAEVMAKKFALKLASDGLVDARKRVELAERQAAKTYEMVDAELRDDIQALREELAEERAWRQRKIK